LTRLFVALPIPLTQRERLRGICCGVRQAGWLSDENFHLTLRFIGEVEEPEVAYIISALSSVRLPQFELRVSGVGHFKSGHKITSLWAKVKMSSALVSLHERIEKVLRRHGLNPDSRKFIPHVTLAKLKNASPVHVRDWLQNNGSFHIPPFNIVGFRLYESYRSNRSAIYTPIHEFPFYTRQV